MSVRSTIPTRRLRHIAVAPVVALLLAVSLAACGTKHSSSAATGGTAASTTACSQVGTKHVPTARFALHAGLAFGAFHHYIYVPYRSGELSKGAPHRLRHLATAAAAAAFTYHELKVAKADAEASHTLCHLVAPLDAIEARMSTLGGQLHGGNVGGVTGANGAVGSLEQQSSTQGTPIQEQVPASL